MSHNGDDEVLTPLCPVCSAPPLFAWAEITPWFCTNDECDVLGWDPYSTLAENLMDATPVEVIHIQGNSDEMPNQ